MVMRTRSRWLGVLGMSLGLSLGFAQISACGESGGDDKKAGDKDVVDSLQDLGIDDGASEGATTSALVAVDKETTLSLKTGAEVKIAAGSTTKELTVTLTRPPDKEALTFIQSTDKKLGSAPYVITPHRQVFDKRVEVTLPLAPQVNADKVQVVYLADEKDRDWKVVGKPQVSAGKAKILVDHFSVLMLVETETIAIPGDGGTVSDPTPSQDAGETIVRPDAPEGSWGAVLFDKLLACGLIESNGQVNLGSEVPAPGSADACELSCVQAAPCDEFSRLWCADSQEGALGACLNACADLTFNCADGDGVALVYQCDGYPDCADGSDELNCPVFECTDGALTYPDAECDGWQDCSDGSDEQNCDGKLFTCADGSQTLPVSYVCDLLVDCPDGSDEPANCVQLTCERPLGSDFGGGTSAAPDDA